MHGLPRHPAEFARGKGLAVLGSAVAARRTGQTFESRGGGTTPFRQRPRKRGLSNSPFPSGPPLISHERDDGDRSDDQGLGQRERPHDAADRRIQHSANYDLGQPVQAAAARVVCVATPNVLRASACSISASRGLQAVRLAVAAPTVSAE